MKYRITLDSGEAFDVAHDEDSLLRGALRAGIGLPHECSVGGCGACRFELVEGAMETLWEEAPGLTERDRRRGKRLACQSKPSADCTIRVRCDDSYRPVVVPSKWRATLRARRALTPDLSEFTFHVPGQAQFRPGQYALLYPSAARGARAYSMSNLPNGEGLWQFIIRRVPGGLGSNALFDAIDVGEQIELDGPYGHAHLREESERDIVCLAGGSGLAPMLSIVRAALAQPGTQRVRFYYCARSQADLDAVNALHALASEHTRLTVSVVLSAPGPTPPWHGETGFVHTLAERELAASMADHEFYFAGPAPMIEALQEMLMLRHRVPFGQIHFDRFV